MKDREQKRRFNFRLVCPQKREDFHRCKKAVYELIKDPHIAPDEIRIDAIQHRIWVLKPCTFYKLLETVEPSVVKALISLMLGGLITSCIALGLTYGITDRAYIVGIATGIVANALVVFSVGLGEAVYFALFYLFWMKPLYSRSVTVEWVHLWEMVGFSAHGDVICEELPKHSPSLVPTGGVLDNDPRNTWSYFY